MTTDDLRCSVAAVYPGPKWQHKVDRMPDNQVYALYHKLVLGDAPAKKKPVWTMVRPVEEVTQLTLF